MIWLMQLKKIRINLVDYGWGEQYVHCKYRAKREWRFFEWGDGCYNAKREPRLLRLVSFTYGPSPEDWQFFWTEPMDNSFKEFWEMIDHPEQALPGAWDKTFDDSESDFGDMELEDSDEAE
jgi:hypothetical protein